MNRRKLLLLLLILTIGLCAACAGETSPPDSSAASDYPNKNINGIVQWGAGGGTDSLMRPLATLAEQQLATNIVIQNMTGATGSIATQYVYDAAADGYQLLMGAENPTLYQALGISKLTYADFQCIFLIGDETVGIVVAADSPYQTCGELLQAALANPGQLRLSTTGIGGLPWEVGAFLTEITGASFKQIPYDSDASAKTAVLNGECDLTICKLQAGLADHQAGSLRYLSLLALEPSAALPDIPLIIDEYPDFANYLPWGPFYGVFVKQGTDPEICQTLSEAFSSAAADAGYQELLAGLQVNYLGLSGTAAQEYIANWQQYTIEALVNSGALEQEQD